MYLIVPLDRRSACSKFSAGSVFAIFANSSIQTAFFTRSTFKEFSPGSAKSDFSSGRKNRDYRGFRAATSAPANEFAAVASGSAEFSDNSTDLTNLAFRSFRVYSNFRGNRSFSAKFAVGAKCRLGSFKILDKSETFRIISWQFRTPPATTISVWGSKLQPLIARWNPTSTVRRATQRSAVRVRFQFRFHRMLIAKPERIATISASWRLM
jgi:hypothetical protein